MDYFCTEKALAEMDKLSPSDLDGYAEDYDSPSGCIIVTDGFDSIYLSTKEDYLPSSRLILYDENYMSIEYFENGIPTWLDPVPGLRIYEADWNGGRWEFTKVNGL